jgi:hypothetical protein
VPPLVFAASNVVLGPAVALGRCWAAAVAVLPLVLAALPVVFSSLPQAARKAAPAPAAVTPNARRRETRPPRRCQ